MAREIERKFLVTDETALQGRRGRGLVQGYLPTPDPVSVRVRLITDPDQGEQAMLTIKVGRSARERLEFEYAIPPDEARELLDTACSECVEKSRYLVEHRGRTWEVDRFEGENAPLLVAEIELDAADEAVELPDWLGPEVTDDHRLLNSNLARRPLAQWEPAERSALLTAAASSEPAEPDGPPDERSHP